VQNANRIFWLDSVLFSWCLCCLNLHHIFFSDDSVFNYYSSINRSFNYCFFRWLSARYSYSCIANAKRTFFIFPFLIN